MTQQPTRRAGNVAADEFFQSHAPVALEFPVTATGVVAEVYAAGADNVRIEVGSSDGGAISGTFSLQVASTLKPGKPGRRTNDRGEVYWPSASVDGDYTDVGSALTARKDRTTVTGPVNRVRIKCTAFSGVGSNLVIWVLGAVV